MPKLPKPHIHFRFKTLVFTGDPKWQVDSEEHRKIPYENILLTISKLLEELTKLMVVREIDNLRYKFDKEGAVEYLKLDAYPDTGYPNVKLQYDIFSCYCTKDWESKGAPPF